MKPPTTTSQAKQGIRLVGDVGGTNARFAVLGASPRDLEGIEILPCVGYASLGDAVSDYLHRNQIASLRDVCIAVAAPVGQDRVDLPNSHWSFSLAALSSELAAPLSVINDFTAQAVALDLMEPEDLTWLGTPRPLAPGIRAVLGPGTGLGIGVQTVSGEIIPSEGGHVGFAPSNDHEMELLRRLLPRFGRVSAERLLSGPGLENIYRANREIDRASPLSDDEACPADRIARLASEGDAIALRTVRDFFEILANFAGDIALLAWATGGVYLSGGVLRRLSAFVDVHRFRERFEDRGRLSGFCRTVPLAWINHDYPGLLGCAATLQRGATSMATYPISEAL